MRTGEELDRTPVSSISNRWNGRTYKLGPDLVVNREGLNRLFILNPSAQFIWQVWRSGAEVNAITQSLAEEYGISLEQAATDVQATLDSWDREGLTGNHLPAAEEPRLDSNRDKPGEGSMHVATGHEFQRTYELGSFEFSVVFNDQSSQQAIHPLFAYCSVPVERLSNATKFYTVRKNNRFELWCESEKLASEDDQDTFSLQAYRAIVTRLCRDLDALMVIHAATVVQGSNCILMAGSSGSGKSTLAAGLALSGLSVFGDDLVPLERESAKAIPLPLPLNLKPESIPVLESLFAIELDATPYRVGDYQVHYLPIPGLDPCTLSNSYKVNKLVFPFYSKGVETKLERLSPSEALSRLLNTGSELTLFNEDYSINKLLTWINSVESHVLEFSDLQESIDCVKELLDSNAF